MSLYQNLINESLDEDLAINREVVKRLKKNFLDNKEKIQANVEVDDTVKNVLQRYFSVFERDLFVIIGNLEKANTSSIIEDVAHVVKSYNDVCIYLLKMMYKSMSNNDRNAIQEKFTSYLASVNLIEEALKKIVSDENIIPIQQIKINITHKNYQPVGFGLEAYVQGQEPRRRIEAKEEEIARRDAPDVEQSARDITETPEELLRQLPNLSQIKKFRNQDLKALLPYVLKLGFNDRRNIRNVKDYLKKLQDTDEQQAIIDEYDAQQNLAQMPQI